MVVGFTTTYAISEFESRSWRGVLDTTLCNKDCQWLAAGRWISPDTPVSTTNKFSPSTLELEWSASISKTLIHLLVYCITFFYCWRIYIVPLICERMFFFRVIWHLKGILRLEMRWNVHLVITRPSRQVLFLRTNFIWFVFMLR